MTTLKDRFFLLQQRFQDISPTRLIAETGFAPPSVYAWFSGKTKTLKHETAVRVAAVYGVDPHWLATGNGDMTPATTSSDAATVNVTAIPAPAQRGAGRPMAELQGIIDELSPVLRTAARSVLLEWINGQATLDEVAIAIDGLRFVSASGQQDSAKKRAA